METRNNEIERERLRVANIGPGLWKYRLPDLGNVGKELREHLVSDAFEKEFLAHTNYNIHGDVSRIDMFSAFAKEVAILDYRPYHASLRTMILILETDYKTERLYDAQILCISDFFDAEIESPLVGQSRWMLEEIINYRLDLQKPLYICSSSPIGDAIWWSSAIRYKITKNIREIYVGKKHGRNKTTIITPQNRIGQRLS